MPGGHPGVHGGNGRLYPDPGVRHARPGGHPVGASSRTRTRRAPRARARSAAPRVPAGVGRPVVGAGADHSSRLPAGVGASRAPAVEPGVIDSGVGGDPGHALQPVPPRAEAGEQSTSLVLSGGQVSSELGIVVMLPDPQAPGGMRAVQVLLASYVLQARGAAGGLFGSGSPVLGRAARASRGWAMGPSRQSRSPRASAGPR